MPVSVIIRPGSIVARGVVGLLADDGDALADADGPVADPPDRHAARRTRSRTGW